MSLVSGHPNIVETFKCLASWRDMGTEAAGELQAACNQGQVRKKCENDGVCVACTTQRVSVDPVLYRCTLRA